MTWITCAGLCAFFILGMWIAHKMDLDKKVKKWANTVPVPDIDGSRVALTDAQARPEEAERPAFLVRIEDRRPTIDRLKTPTADWETASAREFWEAMKATEDAKRRAANHD